MAHRADLDHLLAPAVLATGSELLGCDFLSQGKHSILRVYIDRPNGVNIDDCEAASRQISALLDVEDPIKSEYTLEVSSPGLDRPLFTLAHYHQAKGSAVKISLRSPIERQRNFTGTISDVRETEIVLQNEGEELCLPFTEISKANLIVNVEDELKKVKGNKHGK